MSTTEAGTPSPQPLVELAAIIVAYRSPALVVDCISALADSTRAPDAIVVVDTDPDGPLALDTGSLAALTAIPTRVVPVPDNPGYSAACNRGAAAVDGEWLLFLNADVVVERECLAAVLAEAERDPAIAIATPALRLPDGRLDHACHRGIPTPLDSMAYKLRLHRLLPRSRRLGHYTLAWLDEAGTHDIEACSGAFLLARRAAFESVGGWDERYWFYAEDLDLCLRVSLAGGRVRYVGSATALHLKGASSHLHRPVAELGPEERATRERVERAIVEAHDLFYREHLEARTPRLLRPLVRGMFAIQRARHGGAA